MLAHVAVTLVRFGVLRQRTCHVAQLLSTPRADQVYRVIEDIYRVASVLRCSRALSHPAVLVSRAARIHLGVRTDYLMRMMPTHCSIVLLSLRRASHKLFVLETTG